LIENYHLISSDDNMASDLIR